mmetsp:Transcript_31242/g.85977  ORF Transcript_31242/g.85977 Transcript_31242/m.85977 type:complete len:185 (-) Transcript_31242:29-583(-)
MNSTASPDPQARGSGHGQQQQRASRAGLGDAEDRGPPKWGTVHESERERVLRVEAETQRLTLPREPWTGRSPPRAQVAAPCASTALHPRRFVQSTRATSALGGFIVSDTRLPYDPIKREEFRPKTKTLLGRPPGRGLVHSISATESAWEPRPVPNSSVEPFQNIAKCTLFGRDPRDVAPSFLRS